MQGIKGHARVPPPGWEDIRAEAIISGITEEAAAIKLLGMRALELDLEATDPFCNGWEPPIWHVCDALLGFPWCYDKSFLKKCRTRMGKEEVEKEEGRKSQVEGRMEEPTDQEVWDWFCERMRKHLGYERAVKMLLILGGNRSAKSEYAAKRCMMMVAEKENARVYAMHMSEARSKRDQQPLFWKYMPLAWQVQVASVKAYIKFKAKTGFAENSFIAFNGSTAIFLNYTQDKDRALQGMEADMVAPDELIPVDWIEDILLRLATRAGMGIPTFTPINGYTPTVKIFCDGAKVMQTIPASLCPRDGGEPDEARALNLAPEEYTDLWKAVDEKRAAMGPQSNPEEVLDWIAEGKVEGGGLKVGGEGGGGKTDRVFDEVPRVMKCKDPRKAVVFFNPSDNPYGNPKEVIADLRKKSRAYVRERFYGQAERTISVLIPKFRRNIHVIPASQIPEGGTNYFLYDPAANRNSFMSWFKRKGPNTYLYREWPGNYAIPGVGVPGPWAIPSGKKDGKNDGAPGEGQKPSFGFGNARYKFEMARLERWGDWRKWGEGKKVEDGRWRVEGGGGKGEEYPADEDLAEWDERNGAEEVITSRFIDSRAASTPRIENDRPVTLQTLYDELNIFFFLTPGADITDGVSKINSALDYEEEDQRSEVGATEGERAEVGATEGQLGRFKNPPHYFISEDCENSIYAVESWMNVDGQEGAVKDPVDLMRYFFTAECEDVGPNDYRARGGVAYGGKGDSGRGENRVYRGPRRLPVSA